MADDGTDLQGVGMNAAKGAAAGASIGGPWGALIGAGVSVATPFITKALGGLFGVSEAEEEERQALERAKAPFRAVAEGGTTQGQAGIAYARGRALQDLQAQASRGTAQQQAGLQRAAMQQGADVQAKYAAQLSELRSREQERARAMLGSVEQLEAERAAKSAQRQRQALSQGIAGAVVPLAQQLLTPSAKTGLTAQEIADYNAQNTKGTAASGDFGASFERSLREGVTGSGAAPATPGTGGGLSSAAAAAALGFSSERVPPKSISTYEQRTGMPGVTDRERALNPSQQVAELQAQRSLATANVGPPQSIDYMAGMGGGEGDFGMGGQGFFSKSAETLAAAKEFSPYARSTFTKPDVGTEQVAPAPLTGDFQPTITDELRKQRPGRMPRRPRPVRGGGGFAL